MLWRNVIARLSWLHTIGFVPDYIPAFTEHILWPISRNSLHRFSRNFQGLWGAWVGPHTKFLGNLSTQFWWGVGKLKLWPRNSPKMGPGAPNFFPWGIPTPTSVPNFRLLRQGVGEGEFFENSQTCELECAKSAQTGSKFGSCLGALPGELEQNIEK